MDVENDIPNNDEMDERLKDFLKYFDNTSNPYNPYEQNLSDEPEKLSNATHEIVFNITANVLEENEKGEKVRSKKICTKYYHIPVPLDGDYDIFMEAFFKFLEQALSSSASQAYDSTNPYNTPKSTEKENSNG